MIEIQLYQPLEIDMKISFPQNWDELFPNEVIAISKAFLTEGHSKPDVLVSILKNRVAIIGGHNMQKDWAHFLDHESLVIDGLPLIDFVYGENTLTIPAEKIIELQKLMLEAPAAGFEKITCGEYEDAEQAFYSFLEITKIPGANGAEPLAQLASILYRPRGHLYNFKDDEERKQLAIKLEKIAPERLFAIYLWYSGCRALLPKMFPIMHKPSDEKEGGNPEMNFVKCIHAGAGPKNGTRDNIRQMKLLEFLFDMEQEAIKAEEIKEMYDNQKP